MKSKRIALKAASFIAAATLSAAMPLSTIGSTFMQSTLTAYAAETSGSLTYEKYDDHVEIIGSDYKATSIEIPASISGLPVTAIGDYAFNGSSLSSVTIPDTVKTIGKYAFSMSANLKSVTIPESVEFIDLRAFEVRIGFSVLRSTIARAIRRLLRSSPYLKTTSAIFSARQRLSAS